MAFAFIPWLAGLLGSLVTFFASYFSKKVATVLAGVTLTLSITVAFTLAIEGTIQAIIYPMPSFVSVAINQIMPSNMSACLAALLTAKVITFVYEHKMALTKKFPWHTL